MQFRALPRLADFLFSRGRGHIAAVETPFIVQCTGGGDVTPSGPPFSSSGHPELPDRWLLGPGAHAELTQKPS